MALTRCSECQGQVSEHAAACPACGAPVRRTAKAAMAPAVPWWQWVLFGLLVAGGVATCVTDKTQPPAEAGLSDGDAAYLCAQAIRAASRDAERAEVPTVLPVRSAGSVVFTWANNTRLLRLRNGLGQEVAATGVCIVDRSGGRIQQLVVDGERLI